MTPFRKKAVLLLTVIVLWAGGCSGEKSSVKPEFKVGVVAVTSGELFRKGAYVITAARYAADKVNAAGGVDVRGDSYQVKLYPADSGGTADTASKVAARLIEKDGVSAIVGGTSSEVALAVAQVCEAHRVPFITPVAGTGKLTSLKYSFRVSYINKVQGKALAKFAVKHLGSEPVGILYAAGSPYSAELARYFKKAYERKGGSISAYEKYSAGDREYYRQLQAIIDSGAKILFLPNDTKKIQLQVAQARKMGFKGTLLGGDLWDPVDLERNSLFVNSYYADHWIPGLPIEGEAEFERDYRKQTGGEPTEMAALTYDAMMSLFAAVEEAGSIEPGRIHTGLVDMPPFKGVTGTFDYNNNGDPDKDVIISTIRDGHSVVKDIIPVD
ncbi:ABC transporter substrate-binding protein [Maridesulfovibrio sp. FT414]|uniref:ABC transporter substrate-binding protein n=1 Tax=Maridesulfovibrio sp. FT414 TaxID=2979469 RepID=UPI003D806864